MKGISIGDPLVTRREPNELWAHMSSDERAAASQASINAQRFDIRVLRAEENGDVLVRIPPSLSASERGEQLRAAEQRLRNRYDGVQVYVEPMEDRNRLRRLRGVRVKGLSDES